MTMLYVWLAIIVVGLIVEFLDAGALASIWISVGGIIPLLMSLWNNNSVWYITLQVVVFGIVTLLCMVFLRKICKKLLFRKEDEKTNVHAFVGKRVKIKSVENDTMYVRINDIDYKAVTKTQNEVFEKGDMVEVVDISGNKVVVEKV